MNKEVECLISYLLDPKNQENQLLKEYVSMLPKKYSYFPIFYGDCFRNTYLKDTFFLKRITNLEANIWNTYKSILDNNMDFETPFKDFLYFYLILLSRSFSINSVIYDNEDSYALVPIGDLYNTHHAYEYKNAFWYFDYNKNLIVEARRDILSGEEILISYNSGCNSDYLLYYGFTLDNNPNIQKIDNIPIVDNSKTLITEISLSFPPTKKTYNLEKIILFIKGKYPEKHQTLNMEKEAYQLILQNLKEYLKIYDNLLIRSRKPEAIEVFRCLSEEKECLRENILFIEEYINNIYI
jgi:hypothetical protein